MAEQPLLALRCRMQLGKVRPFLNGVKALSVRKQASWLLHLAENDSNVDKAHEGINAGESPSESVDEAGRKVLFQGQPTAKELAEQHKV